MKTSLWAICFFLLSVSNIQAFQYPTETGFSEVPIIEITDLQHNMESILVLDVRSSPEFNTAHIKGAKHCKISKNKFLENAKRLLTESGKSQVVTYCNGPTCLKAPKSAKVLIENGIQARALYAGVPGWADTHPELTVLRGKPISADNQLIPKSEFKNRCLDFTAFKKKAAEPNTIVIDIREGIQHSGKLPLGEIEPRNIPLDNFIPGVVQKRKWQDKTLLIFDQVGKQAQALQYVLKENGYSNYYFLNKGATKVLGKQVYR